MLNHVKKAVQTNQFIVATEAGILHQMQRDNPTKHYIPAPSKRRQYLCVHGGYCFYESNMLENRA